MIKTYIEQLEEQNEQLQREKAIVEEKLAKLEEVMNVPRTIKFDKESIRYIRTLIGDEIITTYATTVSNIYKEELIKLLKEYYNRNYDDE